MRINEAAQEAHAISRSKGWYETDRRPLEFQMLMVSEIAEMTECARSGEPDKHYGKLHPSAPTNFIEAKGWKIEDRNGKQYFLSPCPDLEKFKPEGELVELADLMIRALDYAAHKGWDLEAAIREKMDYNRTRPHRHGGKLA